MSVSASCAKSVSFGELRKPEKVFCNNGQTPHPSPEETKGFLTNPTNLDKNNNGREHRGGNPTQHLGNGTTSNSTNTTDAEPMACTYKSEELVDSNPDFISGQMEGPTRCLLVNQETFLVDVIVRNAVSPLNFSIQSYRESILLKNLEAEMTRWYSAYEKESIHPALQFKDLSLDGYYAVKWKNDKGAERWVRCQIKKPFSENLPILTYLVDQGCYYSTEPKCIRPLRREYCKMPCQAFDAKLHFVESTKSSYTPEDCHRFHKQVEGKAFCAIVIKNPSNDVQDNKLTVILVDTSTEKDHYVHHDFVNVGHRSNASWK